MTDTGQTVRTFRARASVARFAGVFPLVLAGVGLLYLGGVAIAWWLKAWLIPVFMLVPVVSAGFGYLFIRQMASLTVQVLPERLRVTQGHRVTVNATWQQMSRLTIRTGDNGPIHEIWLKKDAIALPVGVVDRGQELVALVSQRARRPWENI